MVDDGSPKFEEDGAGSYTSFQNDSCSPSFTIINFKNPAEEERKRHERNCRCLFFLTFKQNIFTHFTLMYHSLALLIVIV